MLQQDVHDQFQSDIFWEVKAGQDIQGERQGSGGCCRRDQQPAYSSLKMARQLDRVTSKAHGTLALVGEMSRAVGMACCSYTRRGLQLQYCVDFQSPKQRKDVRKGAVKIQKDLSGLEGLIIRSDQIGRVFLKSKSV